MGGKNTPAPPPPVEPAGMDMNAMMAMMQGMMGMMGSMQAPAMPEIPEAPEVIKEEEIDWTDRQKKLAAKSKADYVKEQAKKKGRNDTTHTSPLLDEQLDKSGSLATG